MERPTLHLTNWSSRAQHGPGRRLCAMARPRWWEHGDGWVLSVAPSELDLADWQAGRLSLDEYRVRYEELIADAADILPPGRLCFARPPARRGQPVQDGDTLLCACPRPDSPRYVRSCHLSWLAPYLVRAAWRVVLYGEEVML